MAKGKEIWVCPQCGVHMDIAPLGLYAEVQCPRCYYTARVHAQLGNFRLDSVLGIGGMSVVYRAWDVVLHRSLALKVLNDTFRDQPERIERFENESAMMARVRHENVTSVYSAGRAYGQFYIAMELVEGRNLEHMVSKDQPLEAAYALNIISQVAQGLEAAHKAGLLHRDMKPGNILITPEEKAKVIDFGLALDSKEGDTEEIIWATPYYVPPETLQREPEDVRTDIYALGMTLRYLLTGVESFDGATDSVTALLESKRKQKAFAKQCPGMPAALCDLVDHMTAFSAAERPADYHELLEEIHEVQDELESIQQTRGNRNGHFFGILFGVLACVGLGLLLAYFVFAEAQKQNYVAMESMTLRNSSECNELQMVLELLDKRAYDNALNRLLALSESTKDSCMGVWSAQLAKTIIRMVPMNADSRGAKAQNLLTYHLNRPEHVSAAGARVYGMFSDLKEQTNPSLGEWTYRSGKWATLDAGKIQQRKSQIQEQAHPAPLRLMEWYDLTEQALWCGDEGMVAEGIGNMRELASKLRDYKGLGSLFDKSQERLAERRAAMYEGMYMKAVESMKKHDLEEAEKIMLRLSTDQRVSKGLKDLATVQHEVCLVGKEMVNMLRRKRSNQYRPGMSGKEMETLAASLPTGWASSVSSDSFQPSNPPEHAVDGDENTRWCANDADPGHYLTIFPNVTDAVETILIRWENENANEIELTLMTVQGEMLRQKFKKNEEVSRIAVGGKALRSIKITVNDTDWWKRWACIREVELYGKGGRKVTASSGGASLLAQEVGIVGLMLQGEISQALDKMDAYLKATEKNRQSFTILANDWSKRWRNALNTQGEERLLSGFLKKNEGQRKSGLDLFDAVRRKDVAALKNGLSAGADPNAYTADGRQNLLSVAIRSGFQEGVRALIDGGANVDAQLPDGLSMLHDAADAGSVEILKMLLEAGANPMVQSSNTAYPIHNALWHSHRDASLVLLPYYKSTGYSPSSDRLGYPIMLALARSGDPVVIRAFLDLGVDPNDQRFVRNPPLVQAAKHNRYDAALLLMERGADKDAKDASGKRAVDYAKGRLAELLKNCKDAQTLSKAVAVRKKELEIIERIKEKDDVAALKKALVEDKIDPNATALNGRESMLTTAIWAGAENCAEALVKAGVSVKDRLPSSATVLHIAASKGNVKILKMLLAAGADPMVQTDNGAYPIHNAIWSFNTQAALALIPYYKSVGYCPDGGQNGYPLTQVIDRSGDMEVIRALLDAGVNPNDKRFTQPPLVCAARCNRLEVARLLLERGADIHAKDEHGKNALDYARGELADLLKRYKSEKRDAPSKSSAMNSLQKSNEKSRPEELALFDVVKKKDHIALTNALAGQVNPNAFSEDGKTNLLAEAIAAGSLECVQALLKAGADANAMLPDTSTMLHRAASAGDVEIIQTLLKAGANPMTQKSNDAYPIHDAIWYMHPEAVKALIPCYKSVGYNPNSRQNGYPITMAIIRGGNLESVRALLDAGVDPNDPLFIQRFPLAYAAQYGREEEVRLLLERGADKKAKDSAGKRAMDYAPSNKMVRLLMEDEELSQREAYRAEKAISRKRPRTPEEMRQDELDVFESIRLKDVDDVKNALRAGLNPNAISADGKDNLISSTIWNNVEECTALLLKHGADPNARCSDGGTVLHAAASKGLPRVIRMLLDAGADPMKQKKSGAYPIHDAIWNHRAAAAIELMPCYKSVGYCPLSKKNGYPISMAIIRGKNEAIVRALLEAGVNPNDPRFGKDPLLVLAARYNRLAEARLLLRYGANKNAKDASGKRAIDYASGELAELLKK